jgi:hypothetical protein
MSSDADTHDPDKLHEQIKESIEKVRDLADEFRIVQEHENAILEDNDAGSDASACRAGSEGEL